MHVANGEYAVADAWAFDSYNMNEIYKKKLCFSTSIGAFILLFLIFFTVVISRISMVCELYKDGFINTCVDLLDKPLIGCFIAISYAALFVLIWKKLIEIQFKHLAIVPFICFTLSIITAYYYVLYVILIPK